MGFLQSNTKTEAPLLSELKEALAVQVIAAGLLDPRSPRVDAFVLAEGLDGEAVTHWCGGGHKRDELFQRARRRGVATQRTAANEVSLLPAGLEAMVQMTPASRSTGHWWYLAAARPGEAFDERAEQLGSLLLRALQAAYDHPVEPELGRVLLSGEFELVHADPHTEARFLLEPQTLEDLRTQLPAVVAQRWPELKDTEVHDLALELGGEGTWVRFQRVEAMPGLGGHWSVELRPLAADDVPPLGPLEDDRVARAVAYLSDHYRSSPTLAEVSEAVQTSPFHFHRLFVKHAGISPKHYLLRMQLMIAKWMLRATRTPIGEIAQATGFASHGHFTATFHRLVGVSPSTFRERS